MPPATTRLLHDTEGAAALIPPRATITSLRAAAAACQACDLWRCGTQTVFGEGPARARCVLVGETPGNDEDLVGRPFVGPAGRLLDEALVEAGIDRAAIYVTNAVKHFKWVARGKKRIHHKPSAREIRACRAWVEAELDVIDPELTVIMGATAAQSLLPSGFRVTKDRGRIFDHAGRRYLATVHPSSILRAPDADTRRYERARFIEDLRTAAKALAA